MAIAVAPVGRVLPRARPVMTAVSTSTTLARPYPLCAAAGPGGSIPICSVKSARLAMNSTPSVTAPPSRGP
jgi:hypothetical protein